MPGPLPISPDTALKLSRYLGVPVEHLMHMPRHMLLQKLAEMAAKEHALNKPEEARKSPNSEADEPDAPVSGPAGPASGPDTKASASAGKVNIPNAEASDQAFGPSAAQDQAPADNPEGGKPR